MRGLHGRVCFGRVFGPSQLAAAAQTENYGALKYVLFILTEPALPPLPLSQLFAEIMSDNVCDR